MSKNIIFNVAPVDMSDRLNAEGKYLMKVSGRVRSQMDDRYTNSTERYIDLSGLNMEQIGVIAGFLDIVFDNYGLLCLDGARIVKKEDIEDES